MVEGETATPYAIVKCFADRIEVDGFDTEPDRNCETPQIQKNATPKKGAAS